MTDPKKPLARHEMLADPRWHVGERNADTHATGVRLDMAREDKKGGVAEGGPTLPQGGPFPAIEGVVSPLTYDHFDPNPRPLEPAQNGFAYCDACEAAVELPFHHCVAEVKP